MCVFVMYFSLCLCASACVGEYACVWHKYGFLFDCSRAVCVGAQVVGSAGNIEGGEAWGPVEDWLATRESDYGFGKLAIMNASFASWEYIRAADGAVLDAFVLQRDRS